MTLIVTCTDQHPCQEFYFVLPTTSPLTSSCLWSGLKSMLLVKVKRTNTKRHKRKKEKKKEANERTKQERGRTIER